MYHFYFHCAHPWVQPYGGLRPCKSSVLTICRCKLRWMRPRLSFLRWRARVHCAHPPAYNRRGRLWAQPCGRLSPCKIVNPDDLSLNHTAMLSVPVSSTGQAPAPASAQICQEQIWTTEGRLQGVRHGGRTSKNPARSLRPSLGATLRAAVAVQIGCPADLSSHPLAQYPSL